MNVVGQKDLALFQESVDNDNDGSGVVVDGCVLELGKLDKHLGSRLEDLHLVKNHGAVVGDDNLAIGGGDHLVHALRSQVGSDDIDEAEHEGVAEVRVHVTLERVASAT
ncbi:hypothetical protein ACFX1S_046252 [Malus domestica]